MGKHNELFECFGLASNRRNRLPRVAGTGDVGITFPKFGD